MALANIPLPGSLIIDPKTGLLSIAWYQLFQGFAQQQGLMFGSGAPVGTQGQNGYFYFRSDGSVGSNVYKKTSGSWAAIL